MTPCRIAITAVAALLAFSLIPASAQVPAAIASSKTVNIGSPLSQIPWGFYDEKHERKGIDVDICGGVVERMGYAVNWVSVDTAGLIPALQARRFDIICSGMFITPEREKVVAFVPYVRSSQAIMMRADAAVKAKAIGDLCGLRVNTLQGSAQQKMLTDQSSACEQQGKKAITVNAFNAHPVAILSLRNANADAYMASDQLVSYYVQQDAALVKVAAGFNPVTLGIAVRPEEPGLVAALGAALAAMKKDGSYAGILAKWGIEGAGIE